MRKVWVASVLVSTILGAPGAARAEHGIFLRDLDTHADACGDFFQFANGTWRAENPIPSPLTKWSRRVAAHDANWHRQQQVLDELALKADWPHGSAEQIAADHYASCMNQPLVESVGITPLAQDLASIRGSRTHRDIERNIRRLHDLGIAIAFAGSVAPGYRDPSHLILSIGAGNLGLLSRDDYLGEDAHRVEVRARYRQHVEQTLVLGGAAEQSAQAAALAVLALETRLARAALDTVAAADPAATDHTVSYRQLKAWAPHFDWDTYFNEAHLPRSMLNVAEPKALKEFDRALVDTPIAAWRAYLEWQLLDVASPALSQAFADESFDFHERFLAGATKAKERTQRCVESTDGVFGDALARPYVARYFPPAAKAKAQDVVEHLRRALQSRLLEDAWMAPETKQVALQKIQATDVQIGYPDRWNDYRHVTVRRDAFWANIAQGRTFNVAAERSLAGRLTERGFWLTSPSPSSSDAYLIVELNKMVLPAGFLQPPFFDPDATDAVNYGAMGIAVAHDLTHFIDTLGAANDLNGLPRNWWTDADRRAFTQRAQCVVEQFDRYDVAPGEHHDGKRVLTESVADLAGVRIAYQGLELSRQTRPVPVLDGFSPEQQFFIAWGQSTGAAMTPEASLKLIKTDPHPVPQFRVIGPLANSPEFQKAFSCPASAAMVRAELCSVW